MFRSHSCCCCWWSWLPPPPTCWLNLNYFLLALLQHRCLLLQAWNNTFNQGKLSTIFENYSSGKYLQTKIAMHFMFRRQFRRLQLPAWRHSAAKTIKNMFSVRKDQERGSDRIHHLLLQIQRTRLHPWRRWWRSLCPCVRRWEWICSDERRHGKLRLFLWKPWSWDYKTKCNFKHNINNSWYWS